MALFGLLGGEAGKRRAFANEVLAGLERSAQPGPWSYDADDFAVVSPTRRLNLAGPYAEYQAASGPLRAAILERLSTPLPQVPAEKLALLACLRPMLRDRGWLELFAIEHRRSFGKPLEGPLPHAELGEHFAVTLVAHLGASMATVTADSLSRAGVSVEEAFAAAGKNLRALAPGFREARKGLWVSVEEDDLDASRLLLPRVRELAVTGAPVALAANRNALFVTGDRDEENLEALAQVARQELADPRALAPLLLRYEGGDWSAWLPHAGSRLYPTFKRWQLKATLDRYNRQKAALEDLEQLVGEGVEAHPLQAYFYGSLMALGDGPDAETMCFWFPTRTLLPKCDVLCLREEENGPIVKVRWDQAMRHASLEQVDGYPERWKAEAFPSPAQLDALRAVAIA